jgi:hypothetical protein
MEVIVPKDSDFARQILLTVDSLKLVKFKSSLLKKYLKLAKKKKPLEDIAEVFAGNGKLMFMVFGGHSSGVILAINCREIPYDTPVQLKEGVEMALCLYRYSESFRSYPCSAGV